MRSYVAAIWPRRAPREREPGVKGWCSGPPAHAPSSRPISSKPIDEGVGMRVLILGGGGLGTVIAGYLGRAGHAVTLFVKPAQAARFAGDEVQVSGLNEFCAPVRVA